MLMQFVQIPLEVLVVDVKQDILEMVLIVMVWLFSKIKIKNKK